MNAIRRALAEGRPSLGCFCSAVTPQSAELLASAGFPWLVIDLQHGAAGWHDAMPLIEATVLGGAVPVVRVGWNDPPTIMRAVDFGAVGVIVPMIDTEDEAASAAAAMRYPPAGVRSFGPTRAVYPSTDAANEDVICLVMIETKDGLRNMEAIAAVDGVDGLFIGPVDMALSLGHGAPPSLRHPAVDKVIDEAVEVANRHGRFVGTVAAGVDHAADLVARGVRFISVASDKGYLRAGAARDVEALKALMASATATG